LRLLLVLWIQRGVRIFDVYYCRFYEDPWYPIQNIQLQDMDDIAFHRCDFESTTFPELLAIRGTRRLTLVECELDYAAAIPLLADTLEWLHCEKEYADGTCEGLDFDLTAFSRLETIRISPAFLSLGETALTYSADLPPYLKRMDWLSPPISPEMSFDDYCYELRLERPGFQRIEMRPSLRDAWKWRHLKPTNAVLYRYVEARQRFVSSLIYGWRWTRAVRPLSKTVKIIFWRGGLGETRQFINYWMQRLRVYFSDLNSELRYH
jgi:hypothetical protein